MSSQTPIVSVVIPCYNEEEVLLACHSRLLEVFSGYEADEVEFIYVNDGSSDRTEELLRYLHDGYTQTRAVMLSRNFGHQAAVTAGLTAATGQCVAIIDADLQDPPEVILQMIERWQAGYEVVYGVRGTRAGESGFKLRSAKLFYRLMNKLSDVEIPLDSGDFRLLDRRAVNAMLAMPERHRLLRGMSSWIGFRQFGLKYDRAPRFAGTTKYPLRKMVKLALDGIFSFSTVPLRAVSVLGLLTTVLSMLGMAGGLAMRLFSPHQATGWTTLILANLMVSGVEMMCFGVVGEYVGRIYTEIKQRPLFIVREMLETGIAMGEATRQPSHTMPRTEVLSRVG